MAADHTCPPGAQNPSTESDLPDVMSLLHWVFDINFNPAFTHCDYQFLSLLSEHLSHQLGAFQQFISLSSLFPAIRIILFEI